jgi:protease secretion system outer membrane protein
MSFQKAERDALLEQSKLGQKFFEKGEGSKTDALESLAAYEISEAKLAEANDLFENAKQKLEAITGTQIKDYSELKPLTYTFKFLPVNPQKYENWKDSALGKNPEIKAAENQIEIAKQEHTKNLAGHAPVLNLIGATSHQQSNTLNTIGTKANQDYVGIQLNIPIFSGGEVNARTTQAYSAYQKSKADLDATKDKVLVELRKQYDSVQTGAIKIQALGRSLESSSLLVESMKNSIRRGERVNVDLLMAQKNLYNVRKDLAQAKYNYLLSYLKLYQQAGLLQPENFQEVAAYFK